MSESIEKSLTFSSPETGDVLTAVRREEAQEMLTRAIRAEVGEWIAGHAHLLDDRGRQQVVRNGHLPKRQVLSGLGPQATEGEKELFLFFPAPGKGVIPIFSVFFVGGQRGG